MSRVPTAALEPCDVLVIGAGAAGMFAAIHASRRGKRVVLLEKNRKPGVKILISGGTRCNLTHACDAQGIMQAFGSAGSFLHSALAALGPEALLQVFQQQGLSTYEEAGTGKIFPQSNRAADVVEVLKRLLAESGATLVLEQPVVEITPLSKLPDADTPPANMLPATQFQVRTTTQLWHAEKVIVAAGGLSYPKCGTTGDGYAWLTRLGHSLKPPRPALVPLLCDLPWVQALTGLVVDAHLRVVDPLAAELPVSPKNRRLGLGPGVLMERRGALLFTHWGLSGPAAMDVSRAVTRPGERLPRLQIDFLPDQSKAAVDIQFKQAAQAHGKRSVLSAFPECLQRRLCEALLQLSGVPADKKLAELSASERQLLVDAVKQTSLELAGTQGFDKAEVTAGGIPLEEVSSKTMESRKVPGLYLVGEILDLDGLIGGYNFQAAFSTGYLAGQHV